MQNFYPWRLIVPTMTLHVHIPSLHWQVINLLKNIFDIQLKQEYKMSDQITIFKVTLFQDFCTLLRGLLLLLLISTIATHFSNNENSSEVWQATWKQYCTRFLVRFLLRNWGIETSITKSICYKQCIAYGFTKSEDPIWQLPPAKKRSLPRIPGAHVVLVLVVTNSQNTAATQRKHFFVCPPPNKLSVQTGN